MSNQFRQNGLKMDELFSVKIDGLTQQVTNNDIEDAFSNYIPRDGRSHMNRGFGFVRFAKKEEAEDAIAAKIELDQKEVELSMASKPKRDDELRRRDEERGYGGGGDRGYGGGGDRYGGGGGRSRRDSRDRGGRGGRRDENSRDRRGGGSRGRDRRRRDSSRDRR